jgi:hypothetical protein
MAGVIGGPGNIDGPASRAHFRSPRGVAERYGALLIADSGNQTIRKYDPATGTVTTLAGAAGESGTTDGVGVAARFIEPRSVVVDLPIYSPEPSKGAWVADKDCIRTLDPSSGAVGTFVGTCGVAGQQDGLPPNASFDTIDSMIVGPRRDALYVCDNRSGVRRIDLSTREVKTLLANPSDFACTYVAADPQNWRVYVGPSDSPIFYFSDQMSGGPGVNPPRYGAGYTNSPNDLLTRGFSFVPGYGIYQLGAIHPVIYHYQIGNTEFDSMPFSGSLAEPAFVDGPVSQARWYDPTAVNTSRTSLYVVDMDSIRQVDLAAMTVSTPLGVHDNTIPADGALGTGRMTGPIAIASDPVGNVYVADVSFYDLRQGITPGVRGNVIRRIDPSGALAPFAGTPVVAMPSLIPIDGTATEATFGVPTAMVYVDGVLYIVDLYGQAIRAVKVSDGSVTTVAGRLGTAGYAEGAGGAARFAFYSQLPESGPPFGGGIASDGTNLYVADTANHAIRKIVIATGEVSTLAGGTKGTANGTGKAAQFLEPLGVAYDRGILYVADRQDNVIRSIDVASAAVTTLAGVSGVAGSTDGDATTATFASPGGLLADGLGGLHVADSYASTTPSGLLRRVDLVTGTVSTIAGTRGQSGVARGPAPSTLNCPAGIALTPAGDTLVSDACDGVIALLSAW